MTPTVVLIHGAGCDHHALVPLREALRARGLEALALDLPGRGAVGGTACATAREAALAVGRELDARGIVRPIVLGHSYGGGVAIELAFAHPLGGLVLASTGARLRVHPAILEMARAAEAAGAASPATAAWTEGAAPPELVEEIDRACRAVPSASTRRDWEACDAFDRLGTLEELRLPTLILAGAVDQLTPPRYAHYLAAHISGAQLELLDGVGHWCVVEAAARAADRIATFASTLAG